MTPKLLRLAYAFEFLVAIVAIFTAWSEIGGQAVLDLMHWGWKLGFSISLAAAIVAYSAAIISTDSVWTVRSIRWLMSNFIITCAMGVITYYYLLQVDAGESDETGTISRFSNSVAPLLVRS